MKISFDKFHGTGNDFILVDNRRPVIDENNSTLIKRLCHRHFGIGADGLILIENSKDADFKMVYFNSDGRPGSLCGNGGRCAIAFANKLRMLKNSSIVFDAFDGTHKATIINSSIMGTAHVSLKMKDVKEVKKAGEDFILNTGSPHYVRLVTDLTKTNVVGLGKDIRYSSDFINEGINVNFVQLTEDGFFVRTYERGVENETLSCGTGVTAAAIVAALQKNEKGDFNFNIKTLGGDLNVKLKTDGKKYSNLFLEGPAEHVFTGLVEV